jgi:hypothetical protein
VVGHALPQRRYLLDTVNSCRANAIHNNLGVAALIIPVLILITGVLQNHYRHDDTSVS